MVELFGDRARAQSRGKVAIDRLDYLRLARANAPVAGFAFNDSVAVAKTSTGHPLQNATLQTASRLLRKVLEEEGVHRALQPYVKLADLTLRQGDNRHRGECHPLEESGRVFLVSADAI